MAFTTQLTIVSPVQFARSEDLKKDLEENTASFCLRLFIVERKIGDVI